MHKSTMKPRGAGARLRENRLTSTESLSKVQINHRAECSQGTPASLLSSSPNPNLLIPGGITIPGVVQGATGCGTQCSGAVDKVGTRRRLDLIWEIFSNFKNSGIQQLFSMGVFSWGRLSLSCPTMDTQPFLAPSTASPSLPGRFEPTPFTQH